MDIQQNIKLTMKQNLKDIIFSIKDGMEQAKNMIKMVDYYLYFFIIKEKKLKNSKIFKF